MEACGRTEPAHGFDAGLVVDVEQGDLATRGNDEFSHGQAKARGAAADDGTRVLDQHRF
jgi:hypothetical protein